MMHGRLDAEHGIIASEIDALSLHAKSAYQAIAENRGKNELMLGWTELPYNQDRVLEQIDEAAAYVRDTFDTFVVLGIGGSALGPIAVQAALNHLRWNELSHRNGPKFYVEDNIDPERMASLLDVIDVKTTCFNVITKSGATAETMSQYLIVSDLLKKEVGEGWQKHIIATTDAKNGNLIKIGKDEGFRLFVIPDGVGGRFSELSPVGLLPAAVCGIDIRALLEGAATMDARCQTSDVWQNPALMEAVLQYIAVENHGANVQVVMPYADSLKFMADWFCQLWAESLGKDVTRAGKSVHYGQTPTKALGVTDQHSQLQL
ncbi:MAG: glucose-6-phosphate isomerase, partial [Firmicutes bacterium]|nr:glucose-6-phosphate isomerase [Bacillota bacterium]